MLILWCVRKPLDLKGVTMSIETRLAKLEAVQQAPRREYTDAERAVKAAWILSKNALGADLVRELLARVPATGDQHGNT